MVEYWNGKLLLFVHLLPGMVIGELNGFFCLYIYSNTWNYTYNIVYPIHMINSDCCVTCTNA